MHTQNSLMYSLQHKVMLIIVALVLIASQNWVAAATLNPEVKTLRVNSYDISYIERGKGEPLILVHGALSDYRTWSSLLDEFSETNRTIAVSLRHYYPEKWNGKGNDLSLQQHADDIAAFIKTIHTGPVNLLGHSRGGAVALLVASQYPKLVSKLILAEPSPLTTMLSKNSESKSTMNLRKIKLQKVMAFYQHGDTEGGLNEFVNYIAGPAAWKRTSELRRNTLRSNAWTLLSLLDDIDIPFSCSDAGKITAPVLLIAGDRSSPLYGYMNSALQACFKKVTKALIGDAGHLMFNENPTAFIFEVQEFISPQ